MTTVILLNNITTLFSSFLSLSILLLGVFDWRVCGWLMDHKYKYLYVVIQELVCFIRHTL